MHSQISTLHLIKRFVPYFKKYKGVLFLDLFCAALTTVCELVFPLIVRYITDMGMNHLESLTVQIILTLGGFYLVLRLIDTAANYYMADVGHIMGAKIETDMRKDLFAHLQKLSYSYYDETKIGQLMARITSDLFDVTEFAHHCPEEFFIAFLKILVSFLILCNSSVLLTVIIFAILLNAAGRHVFQQADAPGVQKVKKSDRRDQRSGRGQPVRGSRGKVLRQRAY